MYSKDYKTFQQLSEVPAMYTENTTPTLSAPNKESTLELTGKHEETHIPNDGFISTSGNSNKVLKKLLDSRSKQIQSLYEVIANLREEISLLEEYHVEEIKKLKASERDLIRILHTYVLKEQAQRNIKRD